MSLFFLVCVHLFPRSSLFSELEEESRETMSKKEEEQQEEKGAWDQSDERNRGGEMSEMQSVANVGELRRQPADTAEPRELLIWNPY